MGKSLRKSILPIIATVVGTAVGGPAGGALAGGAYNYSQNHNLLGALASAGGSYVGANLGGSLAGGAGGFGPGGTIGSALNAGIGPDLAGSLGSIIGPSNFGANLGSTLGSFAGSSIGSDLASSLVPQTAGNVQGEGATTAFKPKREEQKQTPFSLQSLGSLNPEQLSSNIATGGVYGGGQGPDEQDYFLNMVNRRLVDDAGRVDENLNDVNPIESSFLSQLGLGGYTNAQDLLEAISKRRQQYA